MHSIFYFSYVIEIICKLSTSKKNMNYVIIFMTRNISKYPIKYAWNTLKNAFFEKYWKKQKRNVWKHLRDIWLSCTEWKKKTTWLYVYSNFRVPNEEIKIHMSHKITFQTILVTFLTLQRLYQMILLDNLLHKIH